uniref:Sec-independent protein translocase component TatC n=1 Tax=Pleurocladia lacustris TaxID=246121 RepID=A0A1I9LVS7_9PHAE|nr:Sec-independent protein translocase component TatC [Pleurocladia lacustris]ANS57553.1 Sec-independent protein translocase component TatC [Pleurocladia lacustris]ANS57697.1 Sec-independent protein translocase component TatC [Pleurocladia lacustris]
MQESFKTLKFKFYPFLDRALNHLILDNFSKELDDLELFFNEHYHETRHRLFYILSFFSIITFLTFYNVKIFVKFLESPVGNIQFFQLAPGEYFISTIIISLYTGILFSLPLIIIQAVFFFRPALTKNEKNIIFYILTGCIFLFFLGLLFSYFLLIPAALKFFLFYSSNVIEPLWSFTQYFSFVTTLFVSAGLVFQVPIVQIMLSVSRIIDPVEMLSCWRPIILVCTILGAILTPSADAITQLLLSGALFLLYFLGSLISITLVNKN